MFLHPVGIALQTCQTVVIHLDNKGIDIATATETVGIIVKRGIEGILVVVVLLVLEERVQTIFLYQQELLRC